MNDEINEKLVNELLTRLGVSERLITASFAALVNKKVEEAPLLIVKSAIKDIESDLWGIIAMSINSPPEELYNNTIKIVKDKMDKFIELGHTLKKVKES